MFFPKRQSILLFSSSPKTHVEPNYHRFVTVNQQQDHSTTTNNNPNNTTNPIRAEERNAQIDGEYSTSRCCCIDRNVGEY